MDPVLGMVLSVLIFTGIFFVYDKRMGFLLRKAQQHSRAVHEEMEQLMDEALARHRKDLETIEALKKDIENLHVTLDMEESMSRSLMRGLIDLSSALQGAGLKFEQPVLEGEQ